MFIENDVFKTIIPLKYDATPEVTLQVKLEKERRIKNKINLQAKAWRFLILQGYEYFVYFFIVFFEYF